MAFQVKSFVSILASMINRVRGTQATLTDFSVGGVLRTLLESPSQEIDELYQQMQLGLLEAIPVATFLSFNFALLPAAAATGTIRVTITPQTALVTVPQGTLFTPTGTQATYLSVSPVTIAAGGTYVDVPVAATLPGADTNLVSGFQFTPSPAPVGFVSATNLAPFLTGSDAETDAQRTLRFQTFIVTLSRGTPAAVRYGASLATVLDANGNVIERVKWVVDVEPYKTDPTQPVAYVLVYIHNGVGSTSAALVAAAQLIDDGSYDSFGNPIPGYTAAGVHLVVNAATEQQLTISSTLTVAAGYDKPTLVQTAQAAIYNYIYNLPIGQPAILAEMTSLVMAITGVTNFVISAPTTDVTVAANVKLMPGSVTPS